MVICLISLWKLQFILLRFQLSNHGNNKQSLSVVIRRSLTFKYLHSKGRAEVNQQPVFLAEFAFIL